MNRIALLLVAFGMLLSLAGCDSAKTPVPHAAKAQAANVFMETAKAGGTDLTLAIDPVKVGDNRLLVTVADPAVEAVEAQVIMATMGHGVIVDLNKVAPGRFEANTGAIDMDGRWMIRVKATPAGGEAKDATFHLVIKP